MPKLAESHEEARKRLTERLDAFEADRVSGVLGGAGLGWLVDRFTHTEPLGLIGGLLIGTGFSIFVAMRTASLATKRAMEAAGPLPSVPDDEEND